jgi:hypothetical protein
MEAKGSVVVRVIVIVVGLPVYLVYRAAKGMLIVLAVLLLMLVELADKAA